MTDTTTVTVAMLRRFGEAMRDSADKATDDESRQADEGGAQVYLMSLDVDAALATLPSEPKPAPAAQPQAALPVLDPPTRAATAHWYSGQWHIEGVELTYTSQYAYDLCDLRVVKGWQAEAEKLREAVEWQSGCTKALLPYQERAVIAESECQRLAAEVTRRYDEATTAWDQARGLEQRAVCAEESFKNAVDQLTDTREKLTAATARIAELEAQVAAARAEERERVAKRLERRAADLAHESERWENPRKRHEEASQAVELRTQAAAVRAMGDA